MSHRPGTFILYMAGIVGGAVLLANIKASQTYRSSAFFQPNTVKNIADSLPSDSEDDFILSAWRFVGRTPYEPIGSSMTFHGENIVCSDCYLPEDTLERDKGNCIAKSSLLASILANRIDHNRIQIVIGDYVGEVNGGHAWLELWRNGDWQILESTKPPSISPWVSAERLRSAYQPHVVLEKNDMIYADNNKIASLIGCNCHISLADLIH